MASVRWIACAISCTATIAHAAPIAPSLERIDRMQRQGTSEGQVVPIYSQLLLYALPDAFRTVSTETRKSRFVQQAVPSRETAERWTQRIVVSGDEALAFSARTYPQKMIDQFVGGVRERCPDTFASIPLPGVFVGSYDTVVAVAGCGTSARGGGSEATMQMVVKGGMDVYTIEWTVRGKATRGPIALQAAEWLDRLKQLAPIRLCSRVAGEKPPYPSCTQRI